MKQQDPNAPMNHEQRKRLNAMCGDLERQVPWMVNGQIRKMHKDQWRHFFVAHVLNNCTAPSIEGDRIIVFSRSSGELTVATAGLCIDLIQSFGDSKDVKWTDPKTVQMLHHYEVMSAA